MGSDTDDAQPRLHHLAAVVAGNALEFYDFLIYATFAVYIGHTFFPAKNPVTNLLLSLATFGIGFATRPVGGFVLGRLGDRMGRKPALMISFALMGVGMLGVGLTPSYAAIGVAAPVLVVLFRLIQGFALGGEVGPATAFMVEAAPAHRRGLFGAMQTTSQGLANLAAALVALALTLAIGAHAVEAWGWRVAFVIGFAIVPFGLLVRRGLPETAPLAAAPARIAGPAGLASGPLAVVGVVLFANVTINTYVNLYMTTYALDTLRMPASAAFQAGLINGLCIIAFSLAGGWLSDRHGRRPIMIASTAFGALVALPAYWLLSRYPSPAMLDAATAAVSIPTSLAAGAILAAVAESFAPGVRSMAVGATYAVAIAVFGGTAQLTVAWLLHATGDPLAPAFYRIAASVAGLVAMVCLPESAPAKAATSA